MASLDIKSSIKHVRLHAYAQKNATVAVAGSDVSDFRSGCFVIEVGAHTADGITVTLQESDDNSTWTDIATGDLDWSTGGSQDLAITASNDNATYYAGYYGNKKYIGATIVDGGAGDAVLGVYLVAGDAKEIPQNT